MAGNRNSGRRPHPPSHSDALSEKLCELLYELGHRELARKKHDQADRASMHRIAALARDALNHHAELHPASPDVRPEDVMAGEAVAA